MPTYAYACTDCDHRFDAVQSFADDSLTVCPECDGRLRKVFNAVGVVFKGGGFYHTDSRKESAPASSASSESTSSSGSSESAKGSSGSANGSPSEPSGASSSTASAPSPAPAAASSTAAS